MHRIHAGVYAVGHARLTYGIPITSVARTLLDLAATARPRELERALAQAERMQRYDGAAIAEVLARSNGHQAPAGWRGRRGPSPPSPAASSSGASSTSSTGRPCRDHG